MYLESHHGTYLRADPNRGINLTTNRGEWEIWTIEQEGFYFYIRSQHRTYLRADPDGTVNLTNVRKGWERWILELENEYFYIKSWYGMYLKADPSGKVDLTKCRGGWEKWICQYNKPLLNNNIVLFNNNLVLLKYPEARYGNLLYLYFIARLYAEEHKLLMANINGIENGVFKINTNIK